MSSPSRRSSAPDVFARTVPFMYERHSFGEAKEADLTKVQVDNQAAEPTEAEKASGKAMLGLTKRLIAMPETVALRAIDKKFYEFLKASGTPFRPSFFLIALPMVERVDAAAQVWQADRDHAADVATAAYPAQVEAMRLLLEPIGQFNPRDYPTPQAFRRRFWCDYRFVNFGVPNVIETIKTEIFERERDKAAREGQKFVSVIEQHMAGTLLRITDALAATLAQRADGTKPALRANALDKLLQYVDTFAARDATNFKGLQAVTRDLKRLAKGLDIETLREDPQLREQTAQAMRDATDAVALLVTEETRRSIRLRDDDSEAA